MYLEYHDITHIFHLSGYGLIIFDFIGRALPPRTGAHVVDHSLTYFSHVRLPRAALLGEINEPVEFLSLIHRVSVGTLFISAIVVPALRIAAFNAASFSQNRLVGSNNGAQVPVMKFRTQHLPILYAFAQSSVLEAFLVSAAQAFLDDRLDPRVRHGIATVFKAACFDNFSSSIQALNERCGWHGHYEHNQNLRLEV